MGLKERIKKLIEWYTDPNPYAYDAYWEGIEDAAQLAQEADALMEEMAEAIEMILMDTESFTAECAIQKFYQYKEQTND